MAQVYFSLGSNQGERLNWLAKATQLIDNRIGKVVCFSDVVESEPWGFKADTSFYNMVLLVDTEMLPTEILESILEIERTMGRTRLGIGYQSRTIDIDILIYDNIIVRTESLIIPHPLMHKRKFVLEPLTAIAPSLIHPVSGCTMNELLMQTDDINNVKLTIAKEKFALLLKSLTLS